jgi:DNA helicase-2/ATP-dependent DNA helicase PcrA
MTRAKKRLTLSLARRRMGYREGGPSWREMEPSRFLTDLPPELFGESVARAVRAREARVAAPVAARPPLVRRHPGALPGEPHIELDAPAAGPQPGRRGSAGPRVDYDFDQRPEAESGAAAFARGERVVHPSLGEGLVVACEGPGRDAKVTVRFFDAGEKRVLARFLGRPG